MASKAESTYRGLSVHRHSTPALTLYEVKDSTGKFLGNVAKTRGEPFRVLNDQTKTAYETRNQAFDSLLS